MLTRLLCGSLLGLAIACGGEPEPIDNHGEPWKPDAPELHKGEAMCPPGDDYEPQVDWEGYVENGSDPVTAARVRVRLPQGDSPGFVLFGSSPELPAPTGTGQVYACVDPQQRWVRGHRYAMLDPMLSDRRLRFKIDRQEPFVAWCELQDLDGPCGHVASVSYDDCRDSNGRKMDCELMLLCMNCACDRTSCHSGSELAGKWVDSHDYAEFDLMVDGERAQGGAGNLDRNQTQLRLYAAD